MSNLSKLCTLSQECADLMGVGEHYRNIVSVRERFVREYCNEHGYDIHHLTLEQVLKIREQDGWKNPEA